MGRRGILFRHSLIYGLLILFMGLSGWCEEEGADKSSLKDYFSLENQAVYRFRSQDGDDDSDFYDYWIIQVHDLLDGRVSGYFSGRIHKDIDSVHDQFAEDPFLSIEEHDDDWEDQVYQLSGEYKDPDGWFGLKLGRQYIEQADWLHIDGGQLSLFERWNHRLQLFIGRPVSYYSPSSDDWAGGVSLESRWQDYGRVRLSYVRYIDDKRDQNDDLYRMDYWNRFGEALRFHARLSFLDDRFQTAAGDLFYIDPAGNYDIVVGIRHWGGLKEQSLEYSPLYSILGDLEEYTYISGRLNLMVSPGWTISPGIAGRFVDGSDRDVHNRQYGNYDLTLIVEPHRHWTVSVSGQYWDVEGDDRFWGVTGEIDYRPSKIWNAAVGTAYLDYDYHVYSDFGYTVENGDVQGSFDGVTNYVTKISPDAYSVYARARVKLTRMLQLRVQGEIEDDSEEDDLFYGLRTSLVFRF